MSYRWHKYLYLEARESLGWCRFCQKFIKQHSFKFKTVLKKNCVCKILQAESRCDQCLVSICSSCGESHGRQKATSRHSLLPIDPSPPSYCSQHPRSELSVYCATCQQVHALFLLLWLFSITGSSLTNSEQNLEPPGTKWKRWYPRLADLDQFFYV